MLPVSDRGVSYINIFNKTYKNVSNNNIKQHNIINEKYFYYIIVNTKTFVVTVLIFDLIARFKEFNSKRINFLQKYYIQFPSSKK